jgi:hypothetical protein
VTRTWVVYEQIQHAVRVFSSVEEQSTAACVLMQHTEVIDRSLVRTR